MSADICCLWWSVLEGWTDGWRECVICKLLNSLPVKCGGEKTICLPDDPTRKAWLGGTLAQDLSSGCFLALFGTSWNATRLHPHIGLVLPKDQASSVGLRVCKRGGEEEDVLVTPKAAVMGSLAFELVASPL